MADFIQSTSINVEGDALVVTSGVILPPVCVKTTQPVSNEDMIQRNLYWCSPLVGLLILISGCLLIFVYFLVREKCSITFGLSSNLRTRYRRIARAKVIAAVVLFFAMLFSAATDSTPIIVTALVLFIISVIAVFLGSSPLRITKAHRGTFWVKGFSPEYIEAIKSSR